MAEEAPLPQPPPEELSEFKNMVSEWTKIDEQVKKLNIAMRERKIHQSALSTSIMEFMQKYGYDNLNTNQGKIVHNVRKVKQPLKLTEIKELILQNPDLSAEELVHKIFEGERPTSTKQSIVRRVPKVSMHLDI
jgi:hypothetical protein